MENGGDQSHVVSKDKVVYEIITMLSIIAPVIVGIDRIVGKRSHSVVFVIVFFVTMEM